MPRSNRHPDAWSPIPNPHEQAADAWTRSVFADCGLGDARTERALTQLRPGALGASLFCSASPQALRTLTLLCTAWAFYDDAIERSGLPEPRVSEALRTGRAHSGATGLVRVFAEVGRHLEGRSLAWRDRFVSAFDYTVDTVREERRLRDRLAHGQIPSVARYLEWRRPNIGLHAMFPLVEHALGREVSIDRVPDPWVQAATDVFLATNDLASVTKDGPARLDLAGCVARERALSSPAANAWVQDFHDQAVQRVQRHWAATAPWCGADVRAWMSAVHQLLAGFARWHRVAPRYAEPLRNAA